MTSPADEVAEAKAALARAQDLMLTLYAESEGLKVALYLKARELEESNGTIQEETHRY